MRRVLDAYRATPGTCGAIRKPDRAFAVHLFARGVPLAVVENALVLACARRLLRPADAPPLGVIRSLAYFSPVIDEVLASGANDAYFQYLRTRLVLLCYSRRAQQSGQHGSLPASTLAARMRRVAIDWGLWRCARPARLPVRWNFG